MKNTTTPVENHNEQWQLNDVIVAVSTPIGRSTRAVIRVSGIGALEIASKIGAGFRHSWARNVFHPTALFIW